jgi:hypothetical protein
MGLQAGVLQGLLHSTIEIDEFSSKMGEDKNIITVSFKVKYEDPAKDLVKFIEGGYKFVLDSAISSGEQDDGSYRVFMEIPRNKNSIDHILEIIEDCKKLSKIDEFRFRYYKNFRSHPLTKENLEKYVITDPEKYGVEKRIAENYNIDNFFAKSNIDKISIDANILTLQKTYSDPMKLRVIDYNTHNNIFSNLKESYNFNDFGEVIYMVKYLGDYDITKYGNKIIIENNGFCLVTERM